MRITVKTKLVLAFSIVIVLSGITAWLGVSNLSSLNETMQGVLGGPVERIELAQALEIDLLLTIRAEKNVLLAGTNLEQRARFDAELVKQRQTFTEHFDRLEAMATAEGKRRLQLLRVTHQQWSDSNDKTARLCATMASSRRH